VKLEADGSAKSAIFAILLHTYPNLEAEALHDQLDQVGGQLDKVLAVRANDSTADPRVQSEAKGHRSLGQATRFR
jgi:hypothetical protein